jgi:hypothetical protein
MTQSKNCRCQVEPGRARPSTMFGIPLFHLDGKRDRNNTVSWWPYDIKRSASLVISAHLSPTPKEQLREARLFLNRRYDDYRSRDLGRDEDFRICDVNGPHLIKLIDHYPGAVHWRTCCHLRDREGKVLNAMENPIEGGDVVVRALLARGNVDSPPPAQPSQTFAPPEGIETSGGLPLPSHERLLDLLASIRTKA